MKIGIVGASVLGVLALGVVAGARAEEPADGTGQELWQPEAGRPAETSAAGTRVAVRARRFRTYRLDREGMAARLATAPEERARVPHERRLVLALPRPDGTFARFAIQESPVMEPGLAAKHPDIETYAGRGLDDAGTTI